MKSPCTCRRPSSRCVPPGKRACPFSTFLGLPLQFLPTGPWVFEEHRLFCPWHDSGLKGPYALTSPSLSLLGIIFLQVSWPKFVKIFKFSLLDSFVCPSGAFSNSTNSNDSDRECFSFPQIIAREKDVNPELANPSSWRLLLTIFILFLKISGCRQHCSSFL